MNQAGTGTGRNGTAAVVETTDPSKTGEAIRRAVEMAGGMAWLEPGQTVAGGTGFLGVGGGYAEFICLLDSELVVAALRKLSSELSAVDDEPIKAPFWQRFLKKSA